ncbi:enoyl-CoA hydratase/isomerase family protein [Nesterenkonia haasae]|uniref:enoyl-CoA hydratase/isomerase family protein n=1 Tax=Nesterenkonia haasae TaxID=2587813 RepID=UPI00139138C3|nr:enoyl-CoA hydratase/isomerase family protein [Nesterenkonia haasae]NDK33120.1 enoyl-CoA hydratase/isomerase family protein [Nesterenkonia haasae]
MNDTIPTEHGEPIEVERRGTALWVWLNRPDVLNALNPEMLDAMDAALADAKADDSVHGVVVAARGRAFCAGSDLRLVQSLNSDDEPTPRGLSSRQQGFLHRVGRTFNALEEFPKPVVAAVQGIAVAGGLELVLCCDLVVASAAASFGDGHANYGLIPGAGGSIRLPRRVGSSLAKRMMFTGDVVPARDLAHTDLLSAVVDAAELESYVDDLMHRMGTKSPLSIRLTKRLVNDSVQAPLDVALRMEIDACELNAQSHDMREGLDAFLQKREPRFLGR